jgi:hypothetical protein
MAGMEEKGQGEGEAADPAREGGESLLHGRPLFLQGLALRPPGGSPLPAAAAAAAAVETRRIFAGRRGPDARQSRRHEPSTIYSADAAQCAVGSGESGRS